MNSFKYRVALTLLFCFPCIGLAQVPPQSKSNKVLPPSPNYTKYTNELFNFEFPDNWVKVDGLSGVLIAPSGAVSEKGVSHGLMVEDDGAYLVVPNLRSSDEDPAITGFKGLETNSNAFVKKVLGSNTHLKVIEPLKLTTVAGREAFTARLKGTSPATGSPEIVIVITSHVRPEDDAVVDGLFSALFVVPESEIDQYEPVFKRFVNSLRFTDK